MISLIRNKTHQRGISIFTLHQDEATVQIQELFVPTFVIALDRKLPQTRHLVIFGVRNYTQRHHL